MLERPTRDFFRTPWYKIRPQKDTALKSSAFHPGKWPSQNLYMHIMISCAWMLLDWWEGHDWLFHLGTWACVSAHFNVIQEVVLACFIETKINVRTNQCNILQCTNCGSIQERVKKFVITMLTQFTTVEHLRTHALFFSHVNLSKQILNIFCLCVDDGSNGLILNFTSKIVLRDS